MVNKTLAPAAALEQIVQDLCIGLHKRLLAGLSTISTG